MSGFPHINRHPSGWTPVNWTPDAPGVASLSQQPSQTDPGLQELNTLPGISSFDSLRPRAPLPQINTEIAQDSSSNQQEEPLKTPNGKRFSAEARKRMIHMSNNGMSCYSINKTLKEMGLSASDSSIKGVIDSAAPKEWERRTPKNSKTIHLEDRAEMHRRAGLNQNFAEIGRHMGFDRTTVRRVLKK